MATTVTAAILADEERSLLNAYYRIPGLATPERVQALVQEHGLDGVYALIREAERFHHPFGNKGA
jgi:hypothetical protein